MKPLLLIVPVVMLAGFAALADTNTPKDLNRWIEASDFNGVAAKFSALTPMKRDSDRQFSLLIASDDKSHGCLITRTYQTVAPKTLDLSSRQVWKVEEPSGAQAISPNLKKEALESDRALAADAQAMADKCTSRPTFLREQEERLACDRLLDHKAFESKKTGRSAWYMETVGGRHIFEYSRNTKQDDYLNNARRGLTFKLVSERGQTMNVRCGHSRSQVAMNQNPEMVVAQYRSLLVSKGIELSKDRRELKAYITNAEQAAREKLDMALGRQSGLVQATGTD